MIFRSEEIKMRIESLKLFDVSQLVIGKFLLMEFQKSKNIKIYIIYKIIHKINISFFL